MRTLLSLSFCAAVLALPASMVAGTIPYPNAGTIAPTVLTYASGNNGINIYYAGSTASFDDSVEVYDVQTHFNSGAILPNHATAVGYEDVGVGSGGLIHAGDQLIFYIVSPEAPNGTYSTSLYASVPSYSADGVNHAYITDYTGTGLGNGIPAGTFVGLEDEPLGRSDFNYNDDTFVFTGVNAVGASTPEPSSLALLGTGLLGAAGALRRRFV